VPNIFQSSCFQPKIGQEYSQNTVSHLLQQARWNDGRILISMTCPGVNIQKDVEPPWGNPFGKVIYNGGFSTSILVYQRLLAKVHAGDGNIWMCRHDPGRERKTERGSIKKKKGANEQVVSR